MKNAEAVTPTVQIGLDVACMVINSIDPTANADPDTLIKVRETATHKVIITHRGQKFSIPHGTLDAAAQATAQAGTTPPLPEAEPEPTTTIKTSPKPPATTVKRSSSQLPAKTTKRTPRKGSH